LIHDPDLLILDEPATGADPLSRRQFSELIARIRADRPGMGVLVATAYMDEAARFDWLVAMDDGRVLATGTPQELLNRTNALTLAAPIIHFVLLAQGVLYRGAGLQVVWPQCLALALIGAVLFGIALVRSGGRDLLSAPAGGHGFNEHITVTSIVGRFLEHYTVVRDWPLAEPVVAAAASGLDQG
jgi:hypothetical protein